MAVSGGKDSLALWHILLTLGYRADALYQSRHRQLLEESHRKVQHYADTSSPLAWRETPGACGGQEAGYSGVGHDSPSAHVFNPCGTIKLSVQSAAIEQEYDVMATGRNLDDEAARLLGNVLHWQNEYLDKIEPHPAGHRWKDCQEGETTLSTLRARIAAYAVVNRLDYIVEECPMAKRLQDDFVEVLNRLETESPGPSSASTRFLDKQAKTDVPTESMTEKDQRTSCLATPADNRPPPAPAPIAKDDGKANPPCHAKCPATPREFCISPRTVITWEGDATDHPPSTHPVTCILAHRRAPSPVALLLIDGRPQCGGGPRCARTGVWAPPTPPLSHYDLVS